MTSAAPTRTLSAAQRKLIAEVRKAAEPYSPEEFAVLVECGTSTYYRWLRGEAVPKSAAYVRNLVSLGVSEETIKTAQHGRYFTLKS